MIEFRDLSLQRGGQKVLRHVNGYVSRGEIVCLLGPSGGGKSSLLRCVNRLLEPPPGSLFVDGQDVLTLDVIRLRRRVGMLLQQPHLFPGTVAENVAYGPRLRSESMSQARLDEILHMAGLSAGFAGSPSDQLSGGEGQRVAIARALANEPEILLLDEPTSALDPAATFHVEDTVGRLRASLGLTVLWVSHDTNQARRVADRIYLLVGGAVADEGDPEVVFQDGDDRLAMAFAQGRLTGNGRAGNGN